MEHLLILSLLSGLATGLGGLILLLFGRPSSSTLAFYLGIATGMMGLLVLVDLIPTSLKYGNIFYTIIGALIGIVIMVIFDKILLRFFSHSESIYNKNSSRNYYLRMGYFMTMAIALHNIPEGLAIGAGYVSHTDLGIRVAFIIALHNIPEGLSVASTLYLGNLSRRNVVLLPLMTGLFIPVGAIISLIVGEIFSHWISIGLSIASGAMIYLVVTEVGPECLKLNRIFGQVGIAVGFLILYLVYNLQ